MEYGVRPADHTEILPIEEHVGQPRLLTAVRLGRIIRSFECRNTVLHVERIADLCLYVMSELYIQWKYNDPCLLSGSLRSRMDDM